MTCKTYAEYAKKNMQNISDQKTLAVCTKICKICKKNAKQLVGRAFEEHTMAKQVYVIV
jgi:hypothetical protein